MRSGVLLSLAALVVLPVVVALVGCDAKSDYSEGDTLKQIAENLRALQAEVQRTSGTGPEVVTCANMQLHLAQATSSGVGTAATAAATFTGVSALDATLNFAGSYVQDANGVAVTLTGQGYDDGIDRAVVLTLGNPDDEGNLSGTLQYTRGDSAYEGDIELSPVEED